MDAGASARRRGNAALLVRDLTIEHVNGGRVVASVNDVSFRIDAGTCVALLGSSGSGKSTIGRSVLGLKARKSGVIIRLAGTELAPDVGKRTARPATPPADGVPELLRGAQPARERRDRDQAWSGAPVEAGGRSAQARSSTCSIWSGCRPSFTHRMPRELSGGERQRVCIARALGASPSVIICDEITSALDVSVQASVLKLLKELQRDLDLSLLFITHDMGVVSYIADSVVMLEHGRVCESGDTDIRAEPSRIRVRTQPDGRGAEPAPVVATAVTKEHVMTVANEVKPSFSLLDGKFYTSEEVFAKEYERIFSREWIYAAHISQFPQKGSFVKICLRRRGDRRRTWRG